MKTKFAKRFLVAIAVVACISAFCVLGACGTSVAGTYTYDYVNGFLQDETAQFVLDKDGTATLTFPGAEFLASDVYVGTYTNEKTTVTIEGLYEEDGASNYPGLWTTWIDSTNGNCKIEVDKKAGTFTPYFFETTDTTDDTTDDNTDNNENENTSELVPPTMPEDGAVATAEYSFVGESGVIEGETIVLALYEKGICTFEDTSAQIPPMQVVFYGTYTKDSKGDIYVSALKDEEGNAIAGAEASMLNFYFVVDGGFKAIVDETSADTYTFAPSMITNVYTYTESSAIGTTETHSLVLYADGTCTLQNLDTKMTQLGGVYYGTYNVDAGESASITVSALKDENGSYIPGVDNPDTSLGFNMNFSYVTGYGFTATLDESAGTFTPAEVTADSTQVE